jgi:hypothetical protein
MLCFAQVQEAAEDSNRQMQEAEQALTMAV